MATITLKIPNEYYFYIVCPKKQIYCFKSTYPLYNKKDEVFQISINGFKIISYITLYIIPKKPSSKYFTGLLLYDDTNYLDIDYELKQFDDKIIEPFIKTHLDNYFSKKAPILGIILKEQEQEPLKKKRKI